jgi:3',5'-cyclic AMP phosphodiesterase CpdA
MSIRIAVVSDLHLGADAAALVKPVSGSGRARSYAVDGPQVDAFKRAVGEVDYLVLLGDVFDLSMVSFEEAWEATGLFLRELTGLTSSIVYVPGNHDFTMWHYLEQDINVTNRIRAGGNPRPFRYSVPGVIDGAASSAAGACRLVGVWANAAGDYDGGYFAPLWSGPGRQFFVAYPNVYVLNGHGSPTLLTHGQYFDPLWSMLGALCLACADRYLPNAVDGEYTLSEFVQVNMPFSILDSSAIGQAGIFADLAQQITEDVSSGRFAKVEDIKAKALRLIDDKLKFDGWFSRVKEWGSDKVLAWVSDKIDDKIEALKTESARRYNAHYVKDRKAEIQDYLRISQRDFAALPGGAPGAFERLIFGHTHVPTVESEVARHQFRGNADAPATTRCQNTGGWIRGGGGDYSATAAILDGGVWSMVPVENGTVGRAFAI